MKQLDLFDWGASRPTAVIIDARLRIQRRIDAYMIELFMGRNDPVREAEIVALPSRKRGAA
jgi:hypothetical protein